MQKFHMMICIDSFLDSTIPGENVVVSAPVGNIGWIVWDRG
jgi:hypothetical protein